MYLSLQLLYYAITMLNLNIDILYILYNGIIKSVSSKMALTFQMNQFWYDYVNINLEI